MSACFSYGLRAGDPIKAITLSHGTTTLWQGLPVPGPVLLGGFTTNFIWCVALNFRNRSGHEYLSARCTKAPMIPNYLLCALAGTTWYFQFFFYTMARRRWAPTGFPVGRCTWRASSSSAACGASRCTNGVGPALRTKGWLAVSLAVLLLSTMVVGYGNYLGTLPH
jgi:L-rhamnose-H+ transport protein